MKKTLKLAAAATILATPAIADTVPVPYNTLNTNMENPLYMPGARVFYSKLSNGLMLKVADDSEAHKDKHHDGSTEFPIIRIQEDMGYGITDRLAAHFSVQYTHDDDIGRTGLSAGRVGLTYRLLNLYNGFVWDIYGDLHLGGVGEMRGQYNIEGADVNNPETQAALAQVVTAQMIANGITPTPQLVKAQVMELAPAYSLLNAHGVIDYDNYSNGMWGFHVGTKVGKVWDKLTTSAFVEVLRTFGDDNSRIRIVGSNTPVAGEYSTALMLAKLGAPSEVAAEFKSTTEVNAGLNAFYQWTSKWSTGAWFRYEHHADQGVEKITTSVAPALEPVKKALEDKLSDMNDGFDAYIIGLSAAHQFTDHAQVAVYGEYTFDNAHERSQNGTDAKVEAGVRVNFKF
ncbi:MAG: hypothetical protein K2L25_01085 [Alphaproteobacteria bacterium]|nr:hypothetical protein [Alphaproteobacteria bacterium]